MQKPSSSGRRDLPIASPCIWLSAAILTERPGNLSPFYLWHLPIVLKSYRQITAAAISNSKSMKSNFIAREGETHNNGDRQQRNYWLGFFGQSRCNRLAAGPDEIGRRSRVFRLQMRP